jgi:hypothetical protein
MKLLVIQKIQILVLLLCLGIASLGLLFAPPKVESHPDSKDIGMFMPADCAPDRILSVSNGRTGLVLAYKTPNGAVKAALYPNALAGDRPEFTFVFLNGK